MKAFRYMMVDIRRSRAYIYGMIYFGVFAHFFAGGQHMASGVCYLVFVALLMQGAVFTYEQKQEIGFINMLPGTDLERSLGRFIMGIFLLGIGFVMFVLVAIIRSVIWNIEINYSPEILISAIGGGLMFMAVQNVIFYAIGKGNSQQVMTLIHIIPGLISFMALSILTEIILAKGEHGNTKILSILQWMNDNGIALTLGILLAGVIFTVAGIFISKKIMSKKDFA